MRRSYHLVAALVSIGLLGATPCVGGERPTLKAIVVRAVGTVTGGRPQEGLSVLSTRRIVPGNLEVSVPVGGLLELVCSTDHAVRIEGPSATQSVAHACATGRFLLPGSFRTLTTVGRSLAVERSVASRIRILELKTRGTEENDPRVPTLLAPRETAVREARPEIRWLQVPGALEYVVELTGERPWRVLLAAENVNCAPERWPSGTVTVCAVPWPPEQPGLKPGETGYLQVGARTGLATPLRSGEAHRLWRLDPSTVDAMAHATASLQGLDLLRTDRLLREAVLLASADLRGEARQAVRASLLEHPSAEGFLLQGALQLDSGLPLAAQGSFRRAACHAKEPALIHEAARGLDAAIELAAER